MKILDHPSVGCPWATFPTWQRNSANARNWRNLAGVCGHMLKGQLLTGEMLTFAYAYNQTQSTDVFTYIESNAKLHENCIFFVIFIIFLLFIFILYKNYLFFVVYCSSSVFFVI